MVKKILYLVFLFSIFFYIFFSFSYASSDVSISQPITSFENLLSKLTNFLSYLYLLLWPLLALGGKFLSNDFVYGASFGIDNILWQLWQFVRTGMNYFLGILLIVSIFVYLLKDNSKLSIKVLAPKLIITAVIVNMSWFIIAVLIDISSILILLASSFANEFNKTLVEKTDLKEKNIFVPIVIDIGNSTGMVAIKGSDNKSYYQCIYSNENKIKNAPCFYVKDGDYKIIDENGDPVNNIISSIKYKDLENTTGILFSLFRYLNSAFLIDNTNSIKANIVLAVMKIFIWLILIIPFILLVIILFVRVLVLWVAIPLSPVLFGFSILGIGDAKAKEQLKNVLTIIFQPAYVMFTLAMGFIFIQAVYMMYSKDSQDNLLKKLGFKEEKPQDYSKTIGDKEEMYHLETLNYKDMFVISTEYKKGNGTTSSNIDLKNIFSFFSWFVVNLLSGFILWALVFTALKSLKITNKLVTSVETYATQAIKTAPILPYGQSVASLEKSLSYLESVPSQIADKQKIEAINYFKNGKSGKDNESSKSKSSNFNDKKTS